MNSVGEELLNEIERVSAKRERWRRYAQDAGAQASFGPAIFLMTADIDAAKQAIADNDPVSCINALQELKGYGDND